jgi:hypothetical protein
LQRSSVAGRLNPDHVHGQTTSQLQFSKYVPDIVHAMTSLLSEQPYPWFYTVSRADARSHPAVHQSVP